ncbi:auxilin-related protein 2-like isoform X2 [Papaver somniferum]|uniref:auxilin-related protein 2-like isoform X2 n=1 Tax=Papaver somniferum TaxID=3469 RepID=UPI000E6FE4D8|nr:auxilin-related protein 2-like isoform X2 [Papaver somniferum]
MDDFPSLLNFGVRPQGKAAPMAASRSTSTGTTTLNNGIGSGGFNASSSSRSAWNSNPGNSFGNDVFGGGGGGGNHKMNKDYDDVFGGPPKYTTPAAESSSTSFDYDSMFPSGSTSSTAQASINPNNARNNNNNYGSSSPVYDKPVYDDDIFEGIPGLKTTSASTKYDDLFPSVTSPPNNQGGGGPLFDDLLGGLGKTEPQYNKNNSGKSDTESGFDDLLSNFGAASPPNDRGTSETNQARQPTVSSANADPFGDFESTATPVYPSTGLFSDQLEQNSKPSNFGSTKVNTTPVSGGIFHDVDPLAGLGKSVPSFSSDMSDRMKDRSPQKTGTNRANSPDFVGKDLNENTSHKRVPGDSYRNSHPTVDMSLKPDENLEAAVNEIWLTVSEVPLFTQPTSAPPPSRPPPRPSQFSSGTRSATSKKVNEYSSQNFSQNWQSPKGGPGSAKSPVVSSIDELEDFAMGKPSNNPDEHGDALSSDEELEKNSAAAASAAAMKDAMDRAEAKFKHAKEVRERENAKAGRVRLPGQQERDDKATQDAQERELREKQERLDNEREQREREQRQLEKERERAREDERNREKASARQAVERATREARDRAAAEARQKAERVAVQRAQAEARERAERAAVQKAQNEARERAAAQAAARAQSEAKEKAAAVARAEADVRHRAERSSVDRANAEARQRASDAARESQQKNENDLESFFGMGSRPSSAPKARTTTSNSSFDAQFPSKAGPEAPQRSNPGTSGNIRKTTSASNMAQDLYSMFEAAPSSGGFQEREGESDERRKARMDRHQKTQERVLNALAEKNERDLQIQREQAERHRIAETLDAEIRRWAAGKETNLRALLSTLQYVLWPECGWQPVSLTDLITGASVKKVYRKATLCVHPDKVQQKGANLQQKYIAEKVFDLLKEAWNKFNSEELF